MEGENRSQTALQRESHRPRIYPVLTVLKVPLQTDKAKKKKLKSEVKVSKAHCQKQKSSVAHPKKIRMNSHVTSFGNTMKFRKKQQCKKKGRYLDFSIWNSPYLVASHTIIPRWFSYYHISLPSRKHPPMDGYCPCFTLSSHVSPVVFFSGEIPSESGQLVIM